MATAALPKPSRTKSRAKSQATESNIPAGATGTTLPAGIARLDPDASLEQLDGYQLLGEFMRVFERVAVDMDLAESLFAQRVHRSQEPLTDSADRSAAILLIQKYGRGGDVSPDIGRVLSPVVDVACEAGANVVVSILGSRPIALELISRHPINRHPARAKIDSMAESLQADGQLEDCVVRVLPGDEQASFQMISGETRWLAAKQIGWQTISCKVISCSDAEAARRVAVHNAERSDLNPIEKARTIESLAGYGFTREQAARDVGLESGSAASHLVRLLKLPEIWQQRVASGELAESFARLLVPIAHVPRLMAKVEESWQVAHAKGAEPWDKEDWQSRDAVEDLVESILRDDTRPMDGKTRINYNRAEVGEYCNYPRLFKRTPEIDAMLEVFELEVDGKKSEVATNLEYFNELNIPLVKAKLAKKLQKDSQSSSSSSKSAAAELSDEERAAKAAEQLAKRIEHWRHDWIISRVAKRIDVGVDTGRVSLLIVLWLTTANLNWHSRDKANTRGAILVACKALGITGDDPFDALARLFGRSETPQTPNLMHVADEIAKQLLAAEDPRGNYPIFTPEQVDQLASLSNLDLETEWSNLSRSTDELDQARFRSFFDLHTNAQLDELATALGFTLGRGIGRGAKTEFFTAPGRVIPIPVPSSIRPFAAKAAAKKASKKRGAK